MKQINMISIVKEGCPNTNVLSHSIVNEGCPKINIRNYLLYDSSYFNIGVF